MGRKLMFVAGLGIGYVLGARAGRERYDKLVSAADKLWTSPRVAKARADVETYARQQAPIIAEKAQAAAKAAPGVVAESARKTAAAAKDVADTTSTAAKDVADKTTTAAKDLADRSGSKAKSVADRTTIIAKDVAGRTTVIARDAASRVTDGPMPDPDSVVSPLES
jgi:hypothetical protein